MTNCRVLVVDDDPAIRKLLLTLLGQFQYSVETACDGKEALQKFVPGEFDVVLSDLRMPGMSGIELLKAIKETDPDVIFLMITGFAEVDTAVEAIKEGAYDYIQKPLSVDTIKASISRAVERKSLKHSLKAMKGLVWALVISVPLWLILGIILATILKR